MAVGKKGKKEKEKVVDKVLVLLSRDGFFFVVVLFLGSHLVLRVPPFVLKLGHLSYSFFGVCISGAEFASLYWSTFT